MAGSFVVACAILISVLQVHGGQPSDCRKRLIPIGGNVRFRYLINHSSSSGNSDISIYNDETVIIDITDYQQNTTDQYEISPEYHDRINIKYFFPNSHMSFTLTNVSSGDEGMHWIEGIDIQQECSDLLILEKPVIGSEKTLTDEEGQVVIMEGGFLVLEGQPAEILGNNTKFNVSMNWLINEETLGTGGPYIVLPERLSIWSIPLSLNGSTLTYRATVDGGSIAMTEVKVNLSVIYVEIHLNTSQRVFIVKPKDLLPAILCGVMTSVEVEEIKHMWIRGNQIITNDTILSLGYADVTMSGAYSCSVISTVTGQRKEKGVFISVQAGYPEQSQVGIIVLSIITGLIAVAFVAVVTFIYMRSRVGHGDQKNGDSKNEDSPNTMDITSSIEMSTYTNLETESRDRQLYDQVIPSTSSQ